MRCAALSVGPRPALACPWAPTPVPTWSSRSAPMGSRTRPTHAFSDSDVSSRSHAFSMRAVARDESSPAIASTSACSSRTAPPPLPGFDSIPSALDAIRRGEMVVVLDDENRENEGDLIGAADLVTPESIAFMVRYTSGVICVGMRGADLDRLALPLMVSSRENEEKMLTAFAVTVDAREGITTGISAVERARTIRALADPATTAADLRRPGHVFPIRARPGGVLERRGHTEAGVDLARLAGCSPAGALCEIVEDDGSMARGPSLQRFSKRWNLKCVTIADLVRYRETMGV